MPGTDTEGRFIVMSVILTVDYDRKQANTAVCSLHRLSVRFLPTTFRCDFLPAIGFG